MLHPVSRRRFFQLSAALSAVTVCSPVLGQSNLTSSKMKYALCNETYESESFQKCCELTAQAGYTGLEIAPFTIGNNVNTISAKKRAELRSIAEKAGLEILGLHWLFGGTKGFYMTSPEKDIQSKTGEYICSLAEFCADLGGKIMVCGSPGQRNLLPGVTLEQAFDYAAVTFEKAVPVLQKCGVTIALEPLGTNETNFLTSGADGIKLIKKIGADDIKLHLDCKGIVYGETISVPEAIHAYKDYLVHFHANDPNRQGPGLGKLDFVPIFQALKDIAYRGWVSVEMFQYPQGRQYAVEKSIAYMKSCVEQLK